MKFKAIIFDMDGVLIDSEVYWEEVEQNFFKSRGVELTADLRGSLIGTSETELLKICKRDFGFKESIEEMLKERTKMADSIYYEKSNPMPGITRLLEILNKEKYSMAIASSSHLYRIEAIVKRFGWEKYFDKLVSAESFSFPGKPAPDIYLHAAKELGFESKECLVFEDVENGVKSAKSAGMFCIAIKDERWVHGDISSADFIVDSLEDKKVYEFLNI